MKSTFRDLYYYLLYFSMWESKFHYRNKMMKKCKLVCVVVAFLPLRVSILVLIAF